MRTTGTYVTTPTLGEVVRVFVPHARPPAPAGRAPRLFELLPVMPRFTIEQARRKLDTTFPTATAAVKLLQELGLLTELTGQKKSRLFSYAAYVELLNSGT